MSIVAPKRFERVRCLGEGGEGVVYEALDRERGIRVALKTLRRATAESLTFLKHEFRAMQDVHHPNLVTLGELVSEGDEFFFTMELVDGVDWVDYVRSSRVSVTELTQTGSDVPSALTRTAPVEAGSDAAGFDEDRLRDALRQLAEAITALHDAGLVHRDIKPSNVRVTLDGRVVVMDFGLVVVTDGSTPWTLQVAGTPAYMAPEQVGLATVGPEADWYAVGVLLFEALTGTIPFNGSAVDVMMRKQREEPPLPSAVTAGVPADLDALCSALMRVVPAARPKGHEVLRALGGSRASHPRKVWSGPQTQAPPFVGRLDESEALLSAYRASRVEPVTVLVEGESGVGKTTLVRQFLQRLSLEVADVVVLAGRCYERESVPYKAFDGVVDAIARVLSHISNEEARAIVPTKPGPLVKVFPVLRRVRAVAERVRGPQPALPPLDLRARAFAALRELLTRLGDRRPLVVAIDDAQWADPDSLALLAELMQPPEAPSLLLVMTARTGTSVAGRGDYAPNAKRPGPTLASTMQWEVRRIELGPLPPGDANLLATELLERAGITDPQVAAWSARQAAGHPLFIDMMIRQADRGAPSTNGDLRLEDALGAMIGQLEQTPRAVLETVSVAGAPMAQEAVARATGVEGEALAKALALLRVSHMVQTHGARRVDRIEPYHDRVRMAVLAHLDPSRRADIHRRIALTLEVSQPVDAESLVMHWQGAGHPEQAAYFAVIAGDRAAEALAFDPAATFYEIALASKARSPAERRALLIKLAEARSNAGRGEAAAEAFRKAAEGAGAFEALELRRREAEELRAAGDIDAFATALHHVLAAVGIHAPRSPLATLFWLLVYGVWQLAVGLRFKERTPDQVPPEARARVDALFAAARGFGTVDPILGRYMCKRATIAALRVGDTSQILRMAALEASNAAAAGGPVSKREQRLIAIARRLADAEGTSAAQTFYRACLGISLHLRGEWNAARESLESAYPSTDSRRAGRQAHVHVFGAWTLMYLGEYREVARRFPRLLADADARGDLYTSVQLRSGYLAVLWLAADDPETARRHIQESLAQWSRKGFLLQHWHATSGETDIELYLGNGAGAYERYARDLPALNKSLLLKCQHVRIGTMFTRGRCAVASATSANASAQVRRQRLAEARRVVRRLEREVHVCAGMFAALVSAGVSNAEGDRPRAMAVLRMAIDRADQTAMAMHAAAARHHLGSLLGGDEGRTLVQKAEEVMRAQDVKVPSRFARVWLPGRWTADS